jgi:hypothetical protein
MRRVPAMNSGRVARHESVNEAVRSYIDAIDLVYRPLFDQVHELIMAAYPDADLVLSYQLPTYKAGKRRLYVGAWQHGISLYGWPQDRDGGFTERHPELRSGKATIRLRPQDAAALADGELLVLVRAALDQDGPDQDAVGSEFNT